MDDQQPYQINLTAYHTVKISSLVIKKLRLLALFKRIRQFFTKLTLKSLLVVKIEKSSTSSAWLQNKSCFFNGRIFIACNSFANKGRNINNARA